MADNKLKHIHDELISAGITKYGLNKLATKELPKILHDEEHIRGIVYGKISTGFTAMLVATDLRIIYIDRRLMYMTTDELTYDVVSGVKNTKSGPFCSVVLHTKVSDYTLRYVNSKCARIFTKYIEQRRLEKGTYNEATDRHTLEPTQPVFNQPVDKQATEFLKENETATLSTIDRTGNVHGAIVYYITDENNLIYITTKSGTDKGRDVYAHSQVALTIHKTGTLQTLQIQGMAEVETNQKTKDAVLARIIKPRKYGKETHLPPVTKLEDGSFMIIRITPTDMKYHDYSKHR